MSSNPKSASSQECCSKCDARQTVLIHETKEHADHHEHTHFAGTSYFKTPSAIAFYIGTLLFAIALFIDKDNALRIGLYLLAYGLIGWEVLMMAWNNIIKGHVFDENFLMGLATIGALCIKEYPEAVAVMFFYRIGEFFQDLAVDRSRKSIESLMDIRPDFAVVRIGEQEHRMNPNEVAIGSHIVVKAGEKIPLDGIILHGSSTLDTSALTGESFPKEVGIGDEVLSGFINQRGLLVIKTTKNFQESTVSKILEMVQHASEKKAKTEQFITTFAKYYTPFVVISAALLAFIPPLIIPGAHFNDWLARSLVFLVVSCPCALVVSIPLTFFGGIGGASKNGILIKGGNFLEALNQATTVVFDKTGTLTKGVFSVTHTETLNGFSAEDVLYAAALAEQHSNHPIAISIKNAAKTTPTETIVSYEELAGYGVRATISEKTILVGSQKLLSDNHIITPAINENGTIVYVSINSVLAGYIVIADALKEESKKAILQLENLGIKRIVMLTGDNQDVAKSVATTLGIKDVFASLLPHEKVEKLESIMASSEGKTIFVGDGINDAPVLARCDVGIAMGGIGSDAAIEAADVVIMGDEISKVPQAILIARKTHQIVWQNIIFALGVKGIILVMGAFGIASMWEAVFGDVGVALIAVLNASRILRVKV